MILRIVFAFLPLFWAIPTLAADHSFEECVLLVEIAKPKSLDGSYPTEFCMYTHTETRGIFVAKACVGVLIESQSQTRHAFYGSKGHWGVEGTCESKKLKEKILEKETLTTVNPISDLKQKRKEGFEVKIKTDKLQVAEVLLEVTDPKKSKK